MDIQAVMDNFKKHGFAVSYFPTKEDAAAYLNEQIDGVSVAAGGSMTIAAMGLQESLSAHNTFLSHSNPPQGMTADEVRRAAMTTDVYLTSANGATTSGELVNIDGAGNRVGSTYFGHKKVYFIVGIQKFEDTLEKAIFRARNIASPKNAQRLHRKTPCALKADRCYDCNSPERICNGLSIHYRKLYSADTEVVIIGEALGY